MMTMIIMMMVTMLMMVRNKWVSKESRASQAPTARGHPTTFIIIIIVKVFIIVKIGIVSIVNKTIIIPTP